MEKREAEAMTLIWVNSGIGQMEKLILATNGVGLVDRCVDLSVETNTARFVFVGIVLGSRSEEE